MDWLWKGVLLLGAYQLTKILVTAFNMLEFFLHSSREVIMNSPKWVVVTGATDGIGLAYAKEFARRKKNVVLIGRSNEKLADCAKQIEKLGAQVKTIQADFSSHDPNLYSNIEAQLENLEIGILINNVGVAVPAEYFHENADDEIDKMININIGTMTKMTKIVLPKMLGKKNCVIVNVGSGGGSIDIPFFACYGATKTYSDFFSRSLNLEFKSKGIIIENHMPAYVATNMSKTKPGFGIPSADEYAKYSIDKIGYSSSFFPYWNHRLQFAAPDILPPYFFRLLVYYLNLREQKIEAAKKQKK